MEKLDSTTKPRKLRVMCLHGYNQNNEAMKFFLRTWSKQYGDLIDFTYVQGQATPIDGPDPAMVKLGFKPPFKSWSDFTAPNGMEGMFDGTIERLGKAKVNGDHGLEAAYALIAHMNRQELPYDGIFAYSQGSMATMSLWKLVKHHSRHVWLKHPLPYFQLDFCSGEWEQNTLGWFGLFNEAGQFMPQLDCMTLCCNKFDPIYRYSIRKQKVFENNIFIEHDQGHQPPPRVNAENLQKITDFIVKQYLLVNDHEQVKPRLAKLYAGLATSPMLKKPAKRRQKRAATAKM